MTLDHQIALCGTFDDLGRLKRLLFN